MPSEAHVLCYTHQQGSLIISVKKLPDLPLTGEKDGKIWMWHRCLQCPRVNKIPPATRRVVMSDAAWGLSFGKFLELSFSNHAATSRVASCGHSLHRDCLRFYGYSSLRLIFSFSVSLSHSISLPQSCVYSVFNSFPLTRLRLSLFHSRDYSVLLFLTHVHAHTYILSHTQRELQMSFFRMISLSLSLSLSHTHTQRNAQSLLSHSPTHACTHTHSP